MQSADVIYLSRFNSINHNALAMTWFAIGTRLCGIMLIPAVSCSYPPSISGRYLGIQCQPNRVSGHRGPCHACQLPTTIVSKTSVLCFLAQCNLGGVLRRRTTGSLYNGELRSLQSYLQRTWAGVRHRNQACGVFMTRYMLEVLRTRIAARCMACSLLFSLQHQTYTLIWCDS